MVSTLSMQKSGPNKIFADTSALASLYIETDSNHSRALELAQFIDENKLQIITSNIVIYETVSVLSQRVNKSRANYFLREFESSGIFPIWVDMETEDLAFQIFKKLESKNVSMFDCLHFATMRAKGIDTVFGFDKHFKKAGFRLLSELVH